MALGSMSFTQARENSERLGNAAANMDDLFSKLNGEMNTLEDVLKSKGGSEMLATYRELESKLSGFSNKIRSFKQFLDVAIQEYEQDDINLIKEIR